jgi:hypothetical protein
MLPQLADSMMCGIDQSAFSFHAYAGKSRETLRGAPDLLPYRPQLGKDMTDNARDEMRKQPQAPQPSLSHPGAAPDSDRAKKSPLGVRRPPTHGKVVPGDRVEANFGKPSGAVGTVEQANEDDAVVKWDGDGRIKLRQPLLKKI